MKFNRRGVFGLFGGAGLRSVSAPHKLQMLQDGEAERRRRITKLNAEFELESLLEMKIPGF